MFLLYILESIEQNTIFFNNSFNFNTTSLTFVHSIVILYIKQ